VSVHADPVLVARGLATGALGYVLKLSAGDDLVPAIHAALRGECHVSSGLQLEDLRQSRR
jgi:DNA-binding NarL/FixJ family response regulator